MDADAEAEFRRFVQARWHALVRTAFLLTGDRGRAEDLVQQTLVKVHRRWSHIAADSPYAYTRAALANESASWWRRRRVEESLGDIPARADRDPSDRYGQVDTRDQLGRAVLLLPPRMRAVVVLRYFEDLSEAETAHALGMSVGSVKSQSSRGLERLRAALSEASGTGETSGTGERSLA